MALVLIMSYSISVISSVPVRVVYVGWVEVALFLTSFFDVVNDFSFLTVVVSEKLFVFVAVTWIVLH